MKKVLITGVTGYIGSNLARALLPDYQVYGMVRHPIRIDYIADIQDRLHLIPFDGSYESMEIALRETRPDLVYHLAACYTGTHGAKETPRLIAANITMGAYLLEAMVAAGSPPLVYASTVVVHYKGEEYCPLNLYAATKQAFSDLLVYYTDAGLLRAVTLILSDTYGPGDHRPKVLNLIKRAAQAKESLALSDGQQDYDVVYIDDVVRAFQLAGEQIMEKSTWHNERFQIVPEKPMTLRETAELMLQVNGLTWNGGWGQRPAPQREICRAVRICPILPGWRAQVSLSEGLRKF